MKIKTKDMIGAALEYEPCITFIEGA